jgi:hypothetical protein
MEVLSIGNEEKSFNFIFPLISLTLDVKINTTIDSEARNRATRKELVVNDVQFFFGLPELFSMKILRQD